LVAPLIHFKFKPENTCIILGAFGCGAFGNNPTDIANIMKNVIVYFGGNYGKIVFGIPNRHGDNFKAFHDVFTN